MALSILKSTKKNPIELIEIINDMRIDADNIMCFLRQFQNKNLIDIKDNVIKTNSYNRIILAVRAIELGADIEKVAGLLQWKEFEGIASLVLEKNNFIVKKNFRFTYLKKKNEIDVIGLKKPIILCIDCKHWKKELKISSLKKIVANQIKRTKNLIKFLPNISTKIECTSWDYGIFIPAILSLIPTRHKFHESVPIIPILKFQDFLNQMLGNMEKIRLFQKSFHQLDQNF